MQEKSFNFLKRFKYMQYILAVPPCKFKLATGLLCLQALQQALTAEDILHPLLKPDFAALVAWAY